MDGLRTACLYSYGCNKTFILGADSNIRDFVLNPKKRNLPRIVRILEELEPYSAYCSIASLMNRSSPFEEDVVRTHWLRRTFRLSHNFLALRKAVAVRKYIPSGVRQELLSCMVSSGEVIAIEDSRIKVVHHRLVQTGKKLSFLDAVEYVSKGFVQEPKIGDFVSIHLGKAREVISREAVERLIEITQESLRDLEA